MTVTYTINLRGLSWITLNAEGRARRTTKDQTRHLYISQGSLSELDTQVELAHMIGYIDDETKAKMQELIHQTQMLLHGLIRSKNS